MGARQVVRWTLFIAATPVIAFELAVGGTDMPILALMCLGFALLWKRPRYVLAGLAIGVAAAAKATAWPAMVVIAVLIAVRDGRRPMLTSLAASAAAAAAIIGPVAILWPSALIDNTIMFPLGLASIKSAAASPLPGHVIAQTGHAGHVIAVGLLVLAGLAIAVSLAILPATRRPGRCMAADHRPHADVPAGAGDPVRVLHLPGRAAGVAADIAAGRTPDPGRVRRIPAMPRLAISGALPAGMAGYAPAVPAGSRWPATTPVF